MTAEDILDNLCGYTEINGEKEPNASVTFNFSNINKSGEVQKVLKERSFIKPSLYINVLNQYTIIDLIFPSEYDAEIRETLKVLEMYTKEVNAFSLAEQVNENEIPVLVFVIMSAEDAASGYIILKNPIFHALTATEPKGPINCIRILFETETLDILTSTESLANIDADIEIEQINMFVMDQEAAIKQEEREERLQREEELLKQYR